jgi:hypothetical protein
MRREKNLEPSWPQLISGTDNAGAALVHKPVPGWWMELAVWIDASCGTKVASFGGKM